jgi:hypothetical protein
MLQKRKKKFKGHSEWTFSHDGRTKLRNVLYVVSKQRYGSSPYVKLILKIPYFGSSASRVYATVSNERHSAAKLLSRAKPAAFPRPSPRSLIHAINALTIP